MNANDNIRGVKIFPEAAGFLAIPFKAAVAAIP
jgi:hypothetical protein